MSKGFKVFIINAISTLISVVLGLLVIWLLSQFTDCCDKDNPVVQIVGWIFTILVFLPICGWLLIKLEPKESLAKSLTPHSSGTG
jgi:ABC-type multidrug transport system fused ATPase/permease subunit